MSKAKDPEPDLLDVVGGGLEKCAQSLFGQPGECVPIESKAASNARVEDLEISDTVNVDGIAVDDRGDTEDERSEAPSVLSPILSTAAINFPEFTAPTMPEIPEMPDVGGQIEKMTAKVLAVGNCQRFERPRGPELPDFNSLWKIGAAKTDGTQITNDMGKDKGCGPLDGASIDSIDSKLSFSSSVDCCALLESREREFDRESFWEDGFEDDEEEEEEHEVNDDDDDDDDDFPDNDGSASALLVEVATTIDTFKAKNAVAPIVENPTFATSNENKNTEAEALVSNSGNSHGAVNSSGEELFIRSTASNDSSNSTVISAQEEAGCSIHKGRRWTSLLRSKIASNKKKQHVLKHCEKGRCPAAPDHATKMMNTASSTLAIAHSSAYEAIKSKRWQVLLDLVKANPHILSLHSSAIKGGTLLHTLAASDDAPDSMVIQILSIWPNLAGCIDDADNTPLHLAAKRTKRPGLVKLFSDYHPQSASIQNVSGDTALYLAASTGSVDSMHILLNADKSMLTVPNRKGQIPLHAACYSTSPSIEVVRTLLLQHEAMSVLPSHVDEFGNTPLCAAIKNKNAAKIVPVFCDKFPDLFGGDDAGNGRPTSLPLHTALLHPHIDADALIRIVNAGPDASAVPLPCGDLPIVVATRRGLSDDVIYAILVQDLPVVVLGPDKEGVSMKEHSYSWHHVLTSCQERYSSVVHEVLRTSNYWERIALALSPSFFDHRAYDSCSESTKESFNCALCIVGRFRINIDCIEAHSIDSDCNVLTATHTQTAPLEEDGETLSPYSEVTVRCYANEKKVVDELFARRGHRVSAAYAEILIHHFPSDRQLAPTPFPLVFERAKETLQEVLSGMNKTDEVSDDEVESVTIHQRRHHIFGRIAEGLQHFHEKGLVHSHLAPENIGLFEEGWKLMSIGGSTPIHTAIGGKVRSYVPPESVERLRPIDPSQGASTKSNVAASDGNSTKMLPASRRPVGRKWGVLFSLRDLGLQKSTSIDVAASNTQDLRPFQSTASKLSQEWSYRIASDVTANPTFDIFAFGLLFVQSYLGSNSLLPTTLEKANDTYFSKVYDFNNEHLKGIKKEMEVIGGKEAADLAAMALQPSPLKRAQTMVEILEHEYFTNIP